MPKNTVVDATGLKSQCKLGETIDSLRTFARFIFWQEGLD